ncbi:hypothetical protein HQ346_16675 [Rhodococcus sp. BP-252]|uniref:hypothetical protein n=1 Tax=unclassified Rhodococcus (in: high G+C Gram-positive bacteria) TaxID=192944 RepID=UPI001C9A3881|nr:MULTISPECIES: hypothetical protein [unclassified Rhodococcus (in: high G+C Gram-positive bacteria)]MBY6413331.1 hypothetical protein [Rhodococcus sp. BP-320]MBY6418065.1 hypothetical protein [Rhodococcus sp. BP-321]MBY6422245.1 hypothetical protein [Rhodococcus sp. BP-324]MBY6428114.1 hypothetical protein [Rhodococcus sp. BP-323]MBY6433252.1 hypothetical protein [Rhodococcus sp. BP-322]
MDLSLLSDTAGPLVPLSILAVCGVICLVHYIVDNDPGWKGVVANILRIVGGIAVIVAIWVVSASFIAIFLAIAAVLFFMAPLFLLGGASGVADRRPLRRDYYRDPYRYDYY